MKRITMCIISMMLCLCMLVPFATVGALAADEEPKEVTATFKLEMLEETSEAVSLELSLTEGRLVCFDAIIKADESAYQCTSIKFSDDVKTFFAENTDGQVAANLDTQIFALANTEELSATMSIATFSFKKLTDRDAVSKDFDVEFTSCYCKNDAEAGDELTVTCTVNKVIGKEEHTHTPKDEWVRTVEPTCKEVGKEVRYCSECGEIADTRDVDRLEHNPAEEWVRTVEPTCKEVGKEVKYCTECGEIADTRDVDRLEHNPAEEWVRTVEPTCKEVGKEVKYCTECGETVATRDVDRLPHTEATEHKDADCHNDGYDRVYCSVCGEEISKSIIPKLNHSETYKDVHLASCTEDGYINTVCKLCGDVLETTVLKHQGHKYVRDVKNATCTEDGYIKFVCSVCQDIGSQTTIAHAGHAWGPYKVVKAATYSSKGLERAECSICGDYLERDIPMIVIPVTELVIVPEKDFTMNFKSTDRLQVAVYPEEAIYSADIVWKSTKPDIVSVDENGYITAKKVGTATIIASTADGKVTASRRITVQYSTWQWIIVYLLFGWLWYV